MSQLRFNESEHVDRQTFFVDIILPLPIPHRYTYRVPFALNDEIVRGGRVIVQFGKKKILTGIVDRIHNNAPKRYEAKLILEVLDDIPTVNDYQLKLIDWMSEYYMCHPGEVLNAAIPSGLKLSSESKVQLHPEWDLEDSGLEYSDQEHLVIEALISQHALNYSDIADILQLKSIYGVLKSLIAKEVILLYEEVKDKYKPKKESRLELSEEYSSDLALEKLFEGLASKPKQEAILLHYLQNKKDDATSLPKKLFNQKGLSPSSLKTLVKKWSPK